MPAVGGGPAIKTCIVIAITAAAGLVLLAAFVGAAGLPLTLGGTGLAICALVAAMATGSRE